MANAKQVGLTAPPGYGAVAPLDKKRHAGMGLKADQGYAWCGEMNAVYVNAVEFFKSALDYPIAFAKEPRTGEFAPMAILGLKARQNLFVDAKGAWRPHTYVPAYFRRYPFCIAEFAPETKDGETQRLVCVQEDQLTREPPTPLFNANGEATPAWEPIHKLLEAIEGARQQTRVLTRRLEALQLLVPFDAVAMPRTGERMRLQGLFRIDEEKLAEVQGKDLKNMMKKGEMRAIYAHLISLENFGRLLDMAQTVAKA
ncbi:MAG TPA: SapC family protein [Solimonas sp.]|nr:SapC family protein [Solimonas sp.]